MFDLNANDGSVQRKEYKSPISDAEPPEGEEQATGDLDKPAALELHRRLFDYFLTEVDIQGPNRLDQEVDADMYDHIHWTEEDLQALKDRGQLPITYNVTTAAINWLLGTEKRMRTDYKILPRRKEQGKPAERKTQFLKYLSDINRTPFHISRAFEDAVKVGIGWLEDAVQDGDFEEPLYTRYESWRNMLWDSAATEMDISDGRYIFRTKWADVDIAAAMFPTRKHIVELSATDLPFLGAWTEDGDEVMDRPETERTEGFLHTNSASGYTRKRVKLVEGWYRAPVNTKFLRGGDFRGEVYDPLSPGHKEAIERQESLQLEKVAMRMHVAIFTTKGLLYNGPSPYRHNRFPFTPIWGNRRDRDGMPYGMVRGLRDIQYDINKRATKALHVFSTNKTIMEEGAVEDLEEFKEEVARPDAIIIKRAGKELTINADRDIGQWNLEMMSRNIQMIQQTSGVTDEMMGRRTNAVSGVAIERRQDQGSLATSKYFDHLRFAQQIRGEKQLANIEQFVDEEKTFRITNMRGGPEYVTVNNGLPDNDIVRSKADFVISEADWNATIRAAAAEQLLQTISNFPPEVGVALLDLVVENMDLPNRDEIVKRIRELNGQRDPDAEEMTPEEQQRQQAGAMQQQAQMAMFAADLKKTLAEAAKAEAQANDIIASMVGKNVSSQGAALKAAMDAAAVPAAAPVADVILHESGFRSKTDLQAEQENAAAQQQQQQAMAGMPQQPNGAPPAEAVGLGRQARVSP